MLAVLLVVGLVIGAGAGYMLAPKGGETIVEVPVEVPVEVHPFAGQTLRIGRTASSTEGLETTVPLIDDIIEPDIQEYLDVTGLDITLDILIEDCQSSESIALEKTQSFKAMGIDAVLGHGWSGQCSASLSYVNENDMILISGSSTSPLLAIAGDMLFRTCPTDFVQAPAIATMWETWGAKAVLTFFRGDAWGDGIYNLLDAGGEWEAHGIVDIGKVRYAPESTEFSNYLDVANDIIGDAIEEYGGAKYVGFQYFGFSESRTFQTQAADYPNIQGSIWMSTESGGRGERMIDETGELCLQTRHFSSLMGVDEGSYLWKSFEERYYAATQYMPSFYSAVEYDAAQMLMKAILETSSMKASNIADVFIEISSQHHGLSGWMLLTAEGDRAAQVFDIWGYMEQDDGTIWFQKWGLYDGRTIEVTWDDAKLIAAGVNAPRITD
jgi:ABC-type branched-subunit amino acid transport system substrate-binding protein